LLLELVLVLQKQLLQLLVQVWPAGTQAVHHQLQLQAELYCCSAGAATAECCS
jgi:hypothetical protein